MGDLTDPNNPNYNPITAGVIQGGRQLNRETIKDVQCLIERDVIPQIKRMQKINWMMDLAIGLFIAFVIYTLIGRNR